MHALKEHMGMYHRLDFDDTLNQPDESPIGEREHVHARVMKAYGMWKVYLDLFTSTKVNSLSVKNTH